MRRRSFLGCLFGAPVCMKSEKKQVIDPSERDFWEGVDSMLRLNKERFSEGLVPIGREGKCPVYEHMKNSSWKQNW